jgi:hypothetical protein
MASMKKEQFVALGRDSTWSGHENLEYEDLREIADEATSLRDEVPDAVKGRLELAGDLIAYSYFEYDFLDAALDQALLTFEMALERRLREVGREFSDRARLYDLINLGDEEYLFERDKSSLHALRRIRNGTAAHPSMDSRAGPIGITLTKDVVYHINQMYADRGLRKERKAKRKDLQEVLDDIVGEGAVLADIPTQKEDKLSLLVHEVRVLLVDNWEPPTEYVIGACPIFDPLPNEDGRIRISPPIYFRVRDWEKSAGKVDLVGNSHATSVRPIKTDENKRRLQEKWKEPLEETDRSVIRDAHRQLGQARRALQLGNPVSKKPTILGEPVTGTITPENSSITIELGSEGLREVVEEDS